MKVRHWFCLAALAAAATASAQIEFKPRADYAARLEPRGIIQHGAGQDPGAFARYSEVMPESGRPVIYMAYISLKDLRPGWADDLRRRMALPLSTFAALQIGLSMTADPEPGTAYEDRVAAGEFDSQIQALVAGLRRLGVPVYLRIGYEFNGRSWNGYRPEPYKEAFRRVTAAIREAEPELEVATVWCAAMDGTRDFEEFYPGDEFVDWYGIDIFAARHFDDPDLALFAAAAEARQKPLMLGETTPRGEGAQSPAAWDRWFEPFFRWMAATPNLKQFNYINWDWAERGEAINPNWVDWGDARLETEDAEAVRGRYIEVLDTAQPPAGPEVGEEDEGEEENAPPTPRLFQHAAGESAFRRALGLSEEHPPAPPGGLEVDPAASGGLGITWAAPEEENAPPLARYYVYRGEELAGFSLTPGYLDESARAGVPVSYQVAFMSRAGTLSDLSGPLEVTPEAIFRSSDQFEDGTTGAWRLDSFQQEARGGIVVEEDAARVTVESVTGTGWHLQFRRFVQLHEGHAYRLTIRACAANPVNVPLWLQQDGAPNTIFHARTLSLTPAWKTFEWVLPAPLTARASLALILGGLPAGAAVAIDRVELIELPQ